MAPASAGPPAARRTPRLGWARSRTRGRAGVTTSAWSRSGARIACRCPTDGAPESDPPASCTGTPGLTRLRRTHRTARQPLALCGVRAERGAGALFVVGPCRQGFRRRDWPSRLESPFRRRRVPTSFARRPSQDRSGGQWNPPGLPWTAASTRVDRRRHGRRELRPGQAIWAPAASGGDVAARAGPSSHGASGGPGDGAAADLARQGRHGHSLPRLSRGGTLRLQERGSATQHEATSPVRPSARPASATIPVPGGSRPRGRRPLSRRGRSRCRTARSAVQLSPAPIPAPSPVPGSSQKSWSRLSGRPASGATRQPSLSASASGLPETRP